uniref:F-box domain-containing protein n=1 Tax=Strongyloides stercoralis TaxID=6248 RepID=A0A0K0E0A7_STRER
MEKDNLFQTIIRQNHILKKILCYLPIKDSCNLSLTSKECLELTREVKKEGIIYYWDEYILFCIVDSETEIELSDINPSDDFYSDYPYDLREMKKLKIVIILRKTITSPGVMKAIGLKINQILKKSPYIHQFSFYFSNPSDGFFSEDLVKEIKSSHVTELEVSILYNFWSITSESNIFRNIVNLKKIKISLQNSIITGIDRKLIDTASLIDGVILEVNFTNININFDNLNISLQNEECVLSYIISKNINLSITGTYYKLINLNRFFKNFTPPNFGLLHGLRFDVTSINDLHEFGTFLPYMLNLQWLGIYFDVDNFNQQSNDNVPPNSYKSFKHLNKLKTIKIIIESKVNYNEEGKDFLDENNLSNVKEVQKIQNIKKRCQEEVFYLLRSAPEIVENLYIYGIPKLTCKMSLMLNSYFPKLNLLFLKKIPNIDIDCLKSFKNLKIYVSYIMDNIMLPESIKIFMICNNFEWNYGGIQRMFIKDIRNQKNNDKTLNYYRNFNKFKKEYTLDGVLKGKIFFNHFHEYYIIKNHFCSILDMI